MELSGIICDLAVALFVTIAKSELEHNYVQSKSKPPHNFGKEVIIVHYHISFEDQFVKSAVI